VDATASAVERQAHFGAVEPRDLAHRCGLGRARVGRGEQPQAAARLRVLLERSTQPAEPAPGDEADERIDTVG